MELTLDQALQKGIKAHKAGKAQEADQYYTAVLKANPKHPDANHNMGVLAVGVGKVQEALPFFKKALESNTSNAQFWLSYIDTLIKLERLAEAKAVFGQAKSKGAKGDSFDQIKKRLGSATSKSSNVQEPPKEQLNALIKLYKQNKLQKVFNEAQKLTKEYTTSLTLWNLMGASAAQIGQLDDAILAFQKALSIKPDYAEAYNNIGNALKDQDKMKEAIEAFTKALSIKPDYAEPFNNMGNALRDQGRLNEAIKVYKNALSIKPDYAEAYNNMGIALKDQGKLEEAIKAYLKALSIKPDYAEAHRNLSPVKKYTENDKQFLQVQRLYKRDGLSGDTQCHLNFALAKMYEDIGKLNQAFRHLSEGNALRKKFLKYSINQDQVLFTKLKNAQPYLLKNKLKINKTSSEVSPIFILGMLRSGTTLVEQIVSSHSEVTGAGELNHVSKFGGKLAVDPRSVSTATVSKFRDEYLADLSKVSNGNHFVTDKMPPNFRFIPLICAAFPEAKIIHVQRNAAATCWSNYKRYFASNSLGYCYDLKDVVAYYNLYKDLMRFWQSQYGDRIYHLNYESLTTDQENETRKLIKYLGLNWQQTCLSPQKNKRSVRTASQQQVRQKVYQGSSEAWRKYEPFLNGAFDSLPSS